MSVRIRMTRAGSKRKPFYRFVVMDSRVQRDGGFLDWVGQYNPISKPHQITVNEEKVSQWLAKGATMSEGVRSLLKKNGTLARLSAATAGKPAAAAEAGGEAPEAQQESAS
jgi:small subunit ribosomal protein S16